MTVLKSRIDSRSEQFRANQAFHQAELNILRQRQAAAIAGDRDAQIERHLARGKLLPRDRVERVIDPHTPFLELSTLAGFELYDDVETPSAGIVTGIGLVHGVPCMFIANDATVKGGTLFPISIKKHIRAQEIAERHRLPCIYLVDSGGAYLPLQDEVFPDKHHFGNSFFRQTNMSSQGIPQIAAVFGGCTAGGAYIPALADETVMVKGLGQIFLGGPAIVEAAIGEVIDAESLGGAELHTRRSGTSDYMVHDEPQALAKIRAIIAKLNWPRPNHQDLRPIVAPRFSADEITGILNSDARDQYDVHEIIARLVDDSDFEPFKPLYGDTLVCGFAHIMGNPIGILANNGVMFSESALKGTHFIELCNQRQTPLLFLQNITGYMVGKEAEEGGIAKNSAKMVYAVSCARVPKYTVVTGGSYGAGNYGMCGRGFNPHFLFAWPTARMATMSPDIAVNVLVSLRKNSLKGGADSAAELDELTAATRTQFEQQADPYYATARLWDDGLIEPSQTRDVLGLCLSLSAAQAHQQGAHPVYRM